VVERVFKEKNIGKIGVPTRYREEGLGKMDFYFLIFNEPKILVFW